MKKGIKALASLFTVYVMVTSPLFGLVNSVKADTTWTDGNGDTFTYGISDNSIIITSVSDNGDGCIVCPATINGLPVSSFFCTSKASVTSIDVSGNPNLTDLRCNNNIQLESLTLGNNSNLSLLICSGTSIEYLDISGCPNIGFISCGETNISSLDISNNPLLIYTFYNCEQMYKSISGVSVQRIANLEGRQYQLNTNIRCEIITPDNAMYRLYNQNNGEHFYTSSSVERTVLEVVGWNYEGVAWFAPTSGTPVYRVYNRFAGDHHYTTDYAEVQYLVTQGWDYEGIGWYSAGSQPLYRLYNPNCTGAGAHHYTTNTEERDYLISIGWRYEGIGWYGM